MDKSVATESSDLDRGGVLTLEELTAFALAADPTEMLDVDAKPFTVGGSSCDDSFLPHWYMPAAIVPAALGWRKWVIFALVALLSMVEISGLCSVFGQLVVG